MSGIFKVLSGREDAIGKLLLRLTLGILLLFHGVAKISNPGSMKFIEGKLLALDLTSYLAYGVYIGEIVAPLLIILGIYTRFGGFLVVGNMLFAILLVHQVLRPRMPLP